MPSVANAKIRMQREERGALFAPIDRFWIEWGRWADVCQFVIGRKPESDGRKLIADSVACGI